MHNCTCNSMDKRCKEYRRLIKLPKIAIKKHDIVLVAVGLVGHGYEWVRKECRVLQVRKNSAKITFKGLGEPIGRDWWVKWVDRALITDMVSRADEPCVCVHHHCRCCNN